MPEPQIAAVASRSHSSVGREVGIERVLLGHSPAEVVYDCR
jgi:hypothetical protein